MRIVLDLHGVIADSKRVVPYNLCCSVFEKAIAVLPVLFQMVLIGPVTEVLNVILSVSTSLPNM